VDAKFELALLSIHESQFSSGFELYETRYHPNTTDRQAIPPKISTPQYQGKDLSLDIRGKHLLICSEQGVGDEAMFASVLPELAIVVKQDPNTRITLACEPRLVELFNRSFDFLTAIPKPENHEYKTLEKELDYWIFVGSLPKLYRNKIEDFHNNQPYLIPDQSLVNVWNTRFNTLPHKINIGISWRGGLVGKRRASRSISLEEMTPILTKVNQNANIINLQYGDHQQEIQSFTEKTGITIFDWEDHDPIKDLNNFAAQISALDLVISIDNSTVHFSGAVGTEVYVLLPFNQDWRWLDHSTDSYWYPNLMTLFRQHSTGVWDDVLNDVSNALDKNSMRSS
jgi:ADP-heptose:LPS heptosyltransferase